MKYIYTVHQYSIPIGQLLLTMFPIGQYEHSLNFDYEDGVACQISSFVLA